MVLYVSGRYAGTTSYVEEAFATRDAAAAYIKGMKWSFEDYIGNGVWKTVTYEHPTDHDGCWHFDVDNPEHEDGPCWFIKEWDVVE